MNTALNPTTLRALKAYGRRRRRQRLVRGLCVTLLAAVAVLILALLFDLFFVLAFPLRLGLSAAVYAVILFILTRAFLFPLFRRATLRELARHYERHHPALSEAILSAVELGQDEADPAIDSELFRAQLQERVAASLAPHDLAAMLPWASLRRWLLAAAATSLCCAVLCIPSSLGFTRMIGRLLAPLADIERVSRTRIHLIEPADPSAVVPRNEPVPIAVETSGAAAAEAFIDLLDEQGRPTQLTMDPVADATSATASAQRFASTLTVPGDSIRFRVRAGDGATRFMTLRAAARPAVVTFHKTYHYPAYAPLPVRMITEPAGDLEAIEGTSVTLALEVDRPIVSGELQSTCGATTETVPLRPLAATTTTLTGTLRLARPGGYRVRLVAAASQLENKFSPAYDVRVQPDGPPSVTVTEPAGEVALSERGQLMIVGEAKDDVALRRVIELMRVNDGPWRETILSEANAPRFAIQRRLRLAPLNLKAGDHVVTKFTAVDGKGLTAESAITTVTIAGADSAADRLKTSAERRLLQQSLDKVRDAARALGDAAKPLQTSDPAHRQEEARKARQLAERTAQAADAAWSQLREAAKGASSRTEAEDLVNLGRLLSQLRNDALDRARAVLGDVAKSPQAPKRDLDRAANQMRSAGAIAERLAKVHADLFLADQAGAASEELSRLAREEDRLAKTAATATDPAELNQLTRRQDATHHDLALAESALDRMAEGLQEWQARSLQAQAERLRKARAVTEQALAAKDPKAMAGDLAKLDETVAAAAAEMETTNANLAAQAERTRQELARSLPKTADAIRGLQREPRNPGNGLSWQGAIASLEDRAALEESRADADFPFVEDTGKAAGALRKLRDSMHGAVPDRPAQEALRDVERAYATIETAHDMEQTSRNLAEQSERERTGVEPNQAAHSAADWRAAEGELQSLQGQVGRLGLPKETAKTMERATKGPEANAIRNEMRERERGRPRNQQRPLQPQAANIDAVRGALDQVAAQVKAQLDSQRQLLAQVAPMIGEQAADAAREAAALKAETTQQADPVRPDSGQPAARQALQKQQDLNRKVGTLRESLRREANAQDLATPRGREQARDADDALALLRQPPPEAEALLAKAAEAPAPAPRREALAQAAKPQGELAQSLQAIAQHYQPPAAPAADTRAQLRQTEAATGVKEALDAQYRDAERLAELAAKTPEALREALVEELPRNAAMRDELGEIADDTLQKAATALAETARKEGKVARDLDQLAKSKPRKIPSLAPQEQRQQDLNKTASSVGADLARAALDAERLNKPNAAPLRQAAEGAQSVARTEMPQAKAAIEQADKAQQPAAAQAPVERARDALAKQAEKLDAAQAPPTPPAAAAPSAAAKWMAQTLDRLDAAALAAQGQAAQPAPPGQPAPLAQASQAAQSAAALAAAARQAAANAPAKVMAQARGDREAAPASDAAPEADDTGSAPPPPDRAATVLPAAPPERGGEWGKLRQQEAKDPAQAQQEAISEDYRQMVGAYFKALARKSGELK